MQEENGEETGGNRQTAQ
jgi:hypothetical protein